MSCEVEAKEKSTSTCLVEERHKVKHGAHIGDPVASTKVKHSKVEDISTFHLDGRKPLSVVIITTYKSGK